MQNLKLVMALSDTFFTSYMLIVSNAGEFGAGGFDGYIKAYGAQLQKANPEAEVLHHDFKVGNRAVQQFLYRQADVTRLQLIIPGSSAGAAEIHYIIPSSEFQGRTRAIESSIGTITPMDKETEQ